MRSWVLAAILLAVPVAPDFSRSASAQPALAQNVPVGLYGCWTYTIHRPEMAFAVIGVGLYSDAAGRKGTFSNDGGRMRFSGGSLDRQSAIYKGGNPPVVSILGPGGDEAAFCQLT